MHSVAMINIQVIVLLCSICDLDTMYKSKFEKKNQNILLSRSSITSLRRQTQISYRFSVLKFAFTASKCTRMDHFEAIFQNFPGGDPPDPHLGEGVNPSPTLPLSALRASVKPSASDLGAPALFNRAPEEKSWTPLHLCSFRPSRR